VANNLFAANKLTGGSAGTLDDIDHNSLTAGDLAIVVDYVNNKVYFYQYDATDATAESSPDIIDPDSHSGGAGRWLLANMQSVPAYWRDILTQTALSGFLSEVGVQYDHLWIPAGAMVPTTTNGCNELIDVEKATADTMLSYLAFDGATEEYADVEVVMPPTWDRGTISAKFYWLPATGCTVGDTVEWQIQGISMSNNDDIDAEAYTDTGEVISDTVLAGIEEHLHITAKTPAVTINGTPALGDLIHFKISRNVSGTDDMGEDAWLLGVLIEYKRTNTVAAWA